MFSFQMSLNKIEILVIIAERDTNLTSPILYHRLGMFRKQSMHSLSLFSLILTMERPGTILLVCKHFSFTPLLTYFCYYIYYG